MRIPDSIRKPRLIFFIGLIFLIGLTFFPLWRITLDAAQFPEGLYLDIWVNKLTGSSDKILQNINTLNHYIGMKYIYEDSIPELEYFPYVLYSMVGFGLVVIILNKSWTFFILFVLITVLSGMGIYDFYLWLYDFGHNLDPKAPIEIPGMSFMPPLFGGKDLLNFHVTSYPRFGTILLIFSVICSFFAFRMKKLNNINAS